MRWDYEAIAFRDSETVEEFALRLQAMVSQLAVLGDTVELEVVKNLCIVPQKYEQVTVSIDTTLDLKTISIEVTRRLTAAEDHSAKRVAAMTRVGPLAAPYSSRTRSGWHA